MNSKLGQKVVKGVGWNFGSSMCIRLIQFLATVILARLLLPSQFGLFAIGSMVITTINMIRDQGLGEALLYFKTDLKQNSNTAFIISIVFGITTWLIIFTAAPYAAVAFDNRSLTWPLRIMALAIVLSSAALVPEALLERELEFRKKAFPEIAMGLSQALVSIILAVSGFGVWSLVCGFVFSNAVFTILVWQAAAWRPSLSFSSESAKKLLGFGKPLMASAVLVIIFSYADQAAIGRWLGMTILGCYTMAFTICHLPATNYAFVINQVMYPAYLKINEDTAALRKAYTQVLRIISLIALPAALWLCVMSGDVIPGLFGQKWQPAVPLVRILAFYGLFRSIGSTANSTLMAVGKPNFIYKMNCLQIVIALPLVYLVVMRFRAEGVAVLFTTACLTASMYSIRKITGIIKMPVSQFIGILVFPLLTSIIAVSASFGVSRMLPAGAAAAIGSLAFTALFYVPAVLKFDKESVNTLRWALGSIKGS